MKTHRSPQNCKTEKQICQLQRDNLDVGDIGLLVGEKHVSVHYKNGDKAGYILIPRSSFDPLIAWYVRPQKIRGVKK